MSRNKPFIIIIIISLITRPNKALTFGSCFSWGSRAYIAIMDGMNGLLPYSYNIYSKIYVHAYALKHKNKFS